MTTTNVNELMEAAVTTDADGNKIIAYLDIPALVAEVLALEQTEAMTRFNSGLSIVKEGIYTYPRSIRKILRVTSGLTG